MSTPTLMAMGRHVRALERVAVVGELLGLNRLAAYRASNAWPLVGPRTSRYVVTERLLRELVFCTPSTTVVQGLTRSSALA